MYVCICNRYRDTQIREVAQSGIQCAVTAYECLGAGPRCGKCLESAQALIDAQHGCAATPTARSLGLQTVG